MVRTWHGHVMASVNQIRPHCVNEVGMTNSKPLAARHGRGTAWEGHAVCESAFNVHSVNLRSSVKAISHSKGNYVVSSPPIGRLQRRRVSL